MVFGSLSCLAGYFLMWFFYYTEYAQFQRNNGQQMSNFLVEYLASINSNFRQIHTNATQTILEEKDVLEMKHDTALWITNLQWTAFRAFFVEHFLRNMLFQNSPQLQLLSVAHSSLFYPGNPGYRYCV